MARKLLLLYLVAFIAFSLCAQVTAQDLAEVHEIDEYEKDMAAGGAVSFKWLIYNKNDSSILVTISGSPLSGEDWSASPNTMYLVIRPDESANVTIDVESTKEVDRMTVPINVWLNASLAADKTVNDPHPVAATVNFLAAPAALEPENKIFWFWDNPLPEPFNARWMTFIINIFIWAGIAGLVIGVIDPSIKRVAKRSRSELDDTVWQIIRLPLFVMIVLFGVFNSLIILSLPSEYMGPITLVYGILVIIILTWLTYRIFAGVIVYYGQTIAAKTETKIDDVLIPVIRKIGGILIFVIGIASLAALFGFDITAFLAGMGVLGIAIAFAAQESLSNFFSGMFLLLDRPFKEGDLIEINGKRCRIEKIGLRSTTLYHRSAHKILVVPNNKLAREMIVNIVEPDLAYRLSLTIGVDYDSDLDKVKEVMVAAARSHPHVIQGKGRMPYARVEDFGDSAIIMKMKLWIDDADKRNRYAGQIRELISKAFKREGIVIPFPTRDIYIKGEG
ncbi:MAG: mechanosensitive ion channel family protein [Thermoplasmata archaeon]